MLLQGELTGGEPGEGEGGEVADLRQGAVVRSFALVAFEGTPEGREPRFLEPFFVGVSVPLTLGAPPRRAGWARAGRNGGGRARWAGCGCLPKLLDHG